MEITAKEVLLELEYLQADIEVIRQKQVSLERQVKQFKRSADTMVTILSNIIKEP